VISFPRSLPLVLFFALGLVLLTGEYYLPGQKSSFQYRAVWPEPRQWGEGFLRWEEVFQKDFVHLLWGLGPWEGWEAGLGTPVGEPLSRSKALGGSGQQKSGPVFVFGGLDCLEIPRLGGAGKFPPVWGVVSFRRPSGLVIFTTEDSQVGGPPRFGVMGRSGHWRVILEESYQTV